MSDLQTIADRIEIEALRAEFTDATMMHDNARVAALFTHDAVYRIPDAGIEQNGSEQIRAGTDQLSGEWEFFVQNAHPGPVHLNGDTASGRAYIFELGRLHDGRSIVNYALFHDRYRRTPDGWKFTERVYEVRYFDTTPLAGSPEVVFDATLPRSGAAKTEPSTITNPPLLTGQDIGEADGAITAAPVELTTAGTHLLGELAAAIAPLTRELFTDLDPGELAVAHRVLVELRQRARTLET